LIKRKLFDKILLMERRERKQGKKLKEAREIEQEERLKHGLEHDK